MTQSWTTEENRAIVRSYMAMLEQELTHQPYSKADARRALASRIDRSPGAIEYKFQNISAVLLSMRSPFIDGYKPAWNYQSSLAQAVLEAVNVDADLARMMETAIMAPAADRVDVMWREGTVPVVALDELWNRKRPVLPVRRDFVQLEEQNRALGLAGEKAIVEFEKRRLANAGCGRLADRVEHVSQTAGDGLGYDISSFDLDGKPRFIEVKTTRRGVNWPMLISRNEVDTSDDLADHYHVYRVFEFAKPKPGLYQLHGPIRRTCDLDPQSYAALPVMSA